MVAWDSGLDSTGGAYKASPDPLAEWDWDGDFMN